jgi:CRISPR/Cas system-associated exonuclease Cas4 (RecB family)
MASSCEECDRTLEEEVPSSATKDGVCAFCAFENLLLG